MFSTLLRTPLWKKAAGAAVSAAALGGIAMQQQPAATEQMNTKEILSSILSTVKSIEGDLGIGGGSNSVSMDNYPVKPKGARSLMCKFLTPELYAKYKDVKTSSGFTLDQAIQAGLDAPHLGVGIIAGDEDSYEAFKDIFDLVIEGWHGYKPDQMHKCDVNPEHLKMTEAQNAKFAEYVVSTRIRAGRSIRHLPLPPNTNRAERRKVESLIKGGLNSMTGELSGVYYPLGGMTDEQEHQLIEDHFLFQKPSPRNVLANCGAARDWPDARGIFHNKAKNFLVWVNEEDHMRVISMEKGGNVKAVFTRFCDAINKVETSIKADGYEYMYSEHLGNICACPSNLGTGLRGSVMLKMPKLYEKMGQEPLEEMVDSMGLQARGSKGEHSPPGAGGVFDISNKYRIGYSEVELVQMMVDGVSKLIELEEKA